MVESKPFVIYEADCSVETAPENANPNVHWRTLVSADRRQSDSIAVGIAEIAPGDHSEMRFHWHDPSEVYFVLSGEGVVYIDGQNYPIGPGAAVFIPGKAWHAAQNTGSETLRIIYAFGVSSMDDVEYHFEKPT